MKLVSGLSTGELLTSGTAGETALGSIQRQCLWCSDCNNSLHITAGSEERRRGPTEWTLTYAQTIDRNFNPDPALACMIGCAIFMIKRAGEGAMSSQQACRRHHMTFATISK